MHTDLITQYVEMCSREHSLLRHIREHDADRPDSHLMTTKKQAMFLSFLVSLTKPVNILEVGVYTGYSSTAMLLAAPEGSHFYGVDTNSTYLTCAKTWWELAGRSWSAWEGRAEEVLADWDEGFIDFAYIDIDDMMVIPDVYEQVLRVTRQGGLIVIDNILWNGEVINTGGRDTEPCVDVIRQFNQFVQHDDRVEMCMLPGLGDGLLLVTKS